MSTKILNVNTRSEAQALAPLAVIILQVSCGYIAIGAGAKL
jgi:hypothetical protein